MMRETIDHLHKEIVYPYLTEGEAKKDREIAHERAVDLMERFIEPNQLLLGVMDSYFTYHHPSLETYVFERKFRNTLGLAAGFDKNGKVLRSVGAMGFGFIEEGSTTLLPYQGNPRPRVFADPDHDSLINRMGFPGDGLFAFIQRLLEKLPEQNQQSVPFEVFVNYAASFPSFTSGWATEDYFLAHVILCKELQQKQIAGFIRNISSPNTVGVRGQQEAEILDEALTLIDTFANKYPDLDQPIILKFGPDLSENQLDQNLEVISKHRVAGICLTNTTTNAEIKSTLSPQFREEVGGGSGRILTELALQKSRYVFEQTDGKLPIIRAGGVVTAEDYWNAHAFGGASLVETYSGWVSKNTSTPNYAYYLTRKLAKAMETVGMESVEELRGSYEPYPFLPDLR